MTKTYHAQTARFIAAIAEAVPKDISSDVMQDWIQNPKALHETLTTALCPLPVNLNFPKWKTMTVGKLGDAHNARKLLAGARIKISDWASWILDSAPFLEFPITFNYVRLTPRELGLRNKSTTAEIYIKASTCGLRLCPAEVALQLWLSDPHALSQGESLFIAASPIRHKNYDHLMFELDHESFGPYLDASDSPPNKRWPDNRKWLFVLS